MWWPPFDGVTEARRWTRVAGCAVVVVVLAVVMKVLWPVSPGNVIQFELAGDADADTYLRFWNVDEKREAAFTILLDLPFLLAYGLGGALLLDGIGRWSASSHEDWSRRLRRCAWLVIAAAAFDVLENGALLIVTMNQAEGWPDVARWMALVKFALLGAFIAASFVAVVLAIAARVRRHRHPVAVLDEAPAETTEDLPVSIPTAHP